jgi:bacteriocin-like protein
MTNQAADFGRKVMRELSDEEMKQVSGGREGTGLANSYGIQGLAPALGARLNNALDGGIGIGPGNGNGQQLTKPPPP